MAAQQARVRAHRLRERVLRALDRVLDLRGRGRALFARLRLEGNGPLPEQHDRKAVDKLLRRALQVSARHSHGVIDRPVQGAVVELVHCAAERVLHEGLDDVFRRIAARGDSVDGIDVDRQRPDAHLAAVPVTAAAENAADMFIRHRARVGPVGQTAQLLFHACCPSPQQVSPPVQAVMHRKGKICGRKRETRSVEFFAGPPTVSCRGGACPSRRNAADQCRLSLKWYALPNCHCEERSDVAISGRHFQFVQGADKNAPTDCVCSGAQRAPGRK